MRYLIKRYEEQDSTPKKKKHKCRPRKLNGRIERKIKIEALKNPAISAGVLANMIESTSGVCVSLIMVRNVLNSPGLFGIVPRKKTLY